MGFNKEAAKQAGKEIGLVLGVIALAAVAIAAFVGVVYLFGYYPVIGIPLVVVGLLVGAFILLYRDAVREQEYRALNDRTKWGWDDSDG